ncbi:factor-independent urate hydroxylase [Nesterenkonia sandarakina]|uniref:Uricase n=1 Tax=Nesterenkonia sandarakina TaxID=272918 RepID=A0A7Z0J3K3_9MICC|nr:urate oxidase [Nesterenkonia sandarakina]NYJ16868.1 urate oxidase [Nesterenkonia sandarakina]
MSSPDVVLGPNQYGKAEVRVVRVNRETPVHQLMDLNVSSMLRGDFTDCYATGDNARVIATDTQKNTVYAFAKEYGIATPEEFLLLLGRHFTDQEEVSGGRWTAESYPWERIQVPGSDGEPQAHAHSFVKSKQEVRTAALTIQDGKEHLLGGFSDLTVLKTTGSEFSGFPRDRYTTLPETQDRIMATDITARWLFSADAGTSQGAGSSQDAATLDAAPLDPVTLDFDAIYAAVKQQVLEQFALVHSLSLQQTLYAAGEAVLAAVPEIEDIRFVMPNNHHYVVDLSPFGLENPNEVFQAGDRPYGLMNASVTRRAAPARPHAWEWLGGFC